MAYKRYLVEFGLGCDLHGMDMTKAATRAVRDAISHCCLCGLQDVLGLTNPAENMRVAVQLFVPQPDEVNREAVLAQVPFGETSLEIQQGGGAAQGLYVESLGDGDTIVAAVAFLTVWVDV